MVARAQEHEAYEAPMIVEIEAVEAQLTRRRSDDSYGNSFGS